MLTSHILLLSQLKHSPSKDSLVWRWPGIWPAEWKLLHSATDWYNPYRYIEVMHLRHETSCNHSNRSITSVKTRVLEWTPMAFGTHYSTYYYETAKKRYREKLGVCVCAPILSLRFLCRSWAQTVTVDRGRESWPLTVTVDHERRFVECDRRSWAQTVTSLA